MSDEGRADPKTFGQFNERLIELCNEFGVEYDGGWGSYADLAASGIESEEDLADGLRRAEGFFMTICPPKPQVDLSALDDPHSVFEYLELFGEEGVEVVGFDDGLLLARKRGMKGHPVGHVSVPRPAGSTLSSPNGEPRK